jgi:dTMP kinase
MTRGIFITLEGGEGSGKSTQIQLLARALSATGIVVTVTREPGGAPGAEQIRTLLVNGDTGRWDPLSEALLHYAARREHLRHTILPALAGGQWVLCDRFADSTMAYQGYGHGLGRDVIAALHAAVVGALAPDLTLILDLPVEAGLARAASRGGEDRYERMDRAFHQRLREGFLDIARHEPGRCAVIDAGVPAERVQSAIRATIRDRLGVDIA